MIYIDYIIRMLFCQGVAQLKGTIKVFDDVVNEKAEKTIIIANY